MDFHDCRVCSEWIWREGIVPISQNACCIPETWLCYHCECAVIFGYLGSSEQGKWIHDYITQSGLELDVYVGNSLVTMHAKCGNLQVAWALFDRLSITNVVSWNHNDFRVYSKWTCRRSFESLLSNAIDRHEAQLSHHGECAFNKCSFRRSPTRHVDS